MATAQATPLSDISAEQLANIIAQATLKVQQTVNPIENRTPPKTSCFNPSGGPKPKLSRLTIFCGAPQEEGNLTVEEITLFNQVKPGHYHRGKWDVFLREDGTGKQTLDIRLPVADMDDRMEIPPTLVQTLKAIIEEGDVRDKRK